MGLFDSGGGGRVGLAGSASQRGPTLPPRPPVAPAEAPATAVGSQCFKIHAKAGFGPLQALASRAETYSPLWGSSPPRSPWTGPQDDMDALPPGGGASGSGSGGPPGKGQQAQQQQVRPRQRGVRQARVRRIAAKWWGLGGRACRSALPALGSVGWECCLRSRTGRWARLCVPSQPRASPPCRPSCRHPPAQPLIELFGSDMYTAGVTLVLLLLGEFRGRLFFWREYRSSWLCARYAGVRCGRVAAAPAATPRLTRTRTSPLPLFPGLLHASMTPRCTC